MSLELPNSQGSEHWISSQDSQGFGSALDLTSSEMAAIDLIDQQYHAGLKVPSRDRTEPLVSPKGLSATNLANYHHLDCDLYLFNSYHAQDQRQSTVKEKFIPVAADAQFSKGNNWEQSLFASLEARNILRRISDDTPLSCYALANIFVESVEPELYISGVTFIPPTFSTEFAARGTREVSFSVAKPDLIKLKRVTLNGMVTVIWEVIDAKSSKQMKTSHHVQIGWYAKCLSALLPSEHLGVAIVSSDIAAVWLPPLGSLPQRVPLSYIFVALDDLIFKRLPGIVYSQKHEVSWHFNPLCAGCSWVNACRTNTVKQRKLGMIPNITPDESRMILDILPHTRSKTDIEELHTLFSDQRKVAALERERPTSIRKIKRHLALDGRTKISAVLVAASSNRPQVTMRRTFAFPYQEDIAVFISVLLDASSRIISHRTDVFLSNTKSAYSTKADNGDLVSDLASIIQWVRSQGATCRVQFYTFSRAELQAIHQCFIDTALSAETIMDDDLLARVRTCIATLCDGAGVLSTMFQPTLLKDVLVDLLGKPSTYIKKAHLQECLNRLGLNADGKVSELRDRLTQHLAMLKTGNSTFSTNRTLGSPPLIVVIQNEVDRLIALPSPGFWGLPEAVYLLCDDGIIAPSEDTLLALASDEDPAHLNQMLAERNFACYSLNSAVRNLISEAIPDPQTVLINNARPLPVDAFMDMCKEPHLRKLFWMQQFEVISRMQELSALRRDDSPDAIILQFVEVREEGREKYFHFTIEDGTLELMAERDTGFFEWLLVEELSDTGIPVENYFDDLQFCSTIFGLGQIQSWNNQHPNAIDAIMVASVIQHDSASRLVTLRVYPWNNSVFLPGKKYRLTPRLIDFNFPKVVRALLALDWETHPDVVPVFVHLMRDPSSFASLIDDTAVDRLVATESSIQRNLNELSRLNVEGAAALVFKDSQRKAMQRLLKSRLLVLHGPPGTGKTYTLALSLLRHVECRYNVFGATTQVFFVTAVTHAAIETFLKKVDYLRNAYKSVSTSNDYDILWLDSMHFDHVLRGSDHKKILDRKTHTHVYCGTAYQLDNFARKSGLQCEAVFIDEASQMGVATSSLVLRWLKHDDSKVILAGDHLQLGTIVAAQYPDSRPSLFGSILDFIVDDRDMAPLARQPESIPSSSPSRDGLVVQITENFRLNPDLADFVSIIYKRPMLSMKTHTRYTAENLCSLHPLHAADYITPYLNALGNAMLSRSQELLTGPRQPFRESSSSGTRPTSLALLTLDVKETSGQLNYESHVKCEASVAAQLVERIGAAIPNASIFVATPHRIQRAAVKTLLAGTLASVDTDGINDLADSFSRVNLRPNRGRRSELQSKAPTRSPIPQSVVVDTVERLQGQEADIVICCLAHTHRPTLVQDLRFLFERRRLNVAISRAKMLCIVISSYEVLRPPLHVLADQQSALGYTYLHAYEERSWKGDISVQL